MLVTAIGGVLGSLYGYLSVLASIPAMIASNIPVPNDFIAAYQSSYFSVLLPIVVVFGWWIGKWRASQIEDLNGWRRPVALILLGLITAVLGYAGSFALFFMSA